MSCLCESRRQKVEGMVCPLLLRQEGFVEASYLQGEAAQPLTQHATLRSQEAYCNYGYCSRLSFSFRLWLDPVAVHFTPLGHPLVWMKRDNMARWR